MKSYKFNCLILHSAIIINLRVGRRLFNEYCNRYQIIMVKETLETPRKRKIVFVKVLVVVQNACITSLRLKNNSSKVTYQNKKRSEKLRDHEKKR